MIMKKHIKQGSNMNKFGTPDYYKERAKERNSLGSNYYKVDAPKVKKSTCSKCGASIVWLKSKKGKNYPVNFSSDYHVVSNDFHNCEEKS